MNSLSMKLKHLFVIILFFIICFFFLNQITYADNDEREYAYLYFYTIDGEEIDELEKRVRIKSDGLSKEYEFKDPNEYRYLPQEGVDGEMIYSEFYDQVKGLYWEEETDDGDLGQYEAGAIERFTPGEHYFRVKSDNPALTGENLIDTPSSEHAYLYFYSTDYEEIIDLEKELTEEDEYTMPDPAEYVHLEGSDNESGLSGNGIYWACTDQDDERYLFKAGDKVKFKPGDYEFHVVTDDPVTVQFRYPIDVPTYFVTENTPGEIYAETEAIPGETIQLKRGLGAIIWGCDFEGWNEVNFEDDDEVFNGGESYQIMDNVDLTFFAVYEENDDWDMNAVDENTGLEPEQAEEELIVDVDAVNEAAGAGYGAYIDSSGTLRRIGGTKKINDDTVLSGIPGEIEDKDYLTSLVDPDADPNDPENYTKDKYGRDFEDSNLEKEMNNVLRQDKSAMYMDVYGNAFVYYSDLSREDNMSIALARLQQGKTDSWVNNIQDWDTEMVNRFEAIEFALLKGEYPEDGEDLFANLDPEVVKGEQLIWKDSYMSESAFKKLLPYKRIWTGWYDRYSDGLYEKYKNSSGGNITQTAKNVVNKLASLFSITAYAEDNDVGEAFQLKSHIITSMDQKEVKYSAIYYDENKGHMYNSYAFSTDKLGLDADQTTVLLKIFTALVDYGFTEEAAAGACGNIWQECTFNPNIEGGILQWQGDRRAGLKELAASKGKSWQDIDIQIEYMIYELNHGDLQEADRILGKLTESPTAEAQTFMTAKNIKAACDAWCWAIERCVCYDSNGKLNKGHDEVHLKEDGSSDCAEIFGKSFQHLNKRREYAGRIYTSLVIFKDMMTGNILNGDQIRAQYFPKLQGSYSMLGTYYSEEEMNSMMRSVPIPGTDKVIKVHMAIADNLRKVLLELWEIGYPINPKDCGGFRYRGIYKNGAYQSVKTKASFHASGLAVDINISHSPYVPRNSSASNENELQKIRSYGYDPANDPLAANMVAYLIFRENGFTWGRDFSTNYDFMHFSVGEVTKDGRSQWVSDALEGKTNSN